MSTESDKQFVEAMTKFRGGQCDKVGLSSSNALLGCPFCGGIDIRHGESSLGSFNEYWIECPKCEVVITRDTKLRTFEAWNKRAT